MIYNLTPKKDKELGMKGVEVRLKPDEKYAPPRQDYQDMQEKKKIKSHLYEQ